MNSSLDTNIILRYIWKDNPNQYKKVVKLLNDKNQVFHVSDLIVSEIIFNLQARGATRKLIVDILNNFFEKKNVNASSFLTDTVLPFFAEHPALSFVDCYAAFEAEKKGREPLFTFDRKLSAQHPSAKRP